VAVLGASDDPERYARKAIDLLQQHGHTVLPVTPKPIQLTGLAVFARLDQAPPPIDTITLYVNPRILESVADEIVRAHPRRVIFNPGTEHPELAVRFEEAGIRTEQACTLVLLNTGQF
jgi:predicted CoA-binding protein